MHQYYFGQYAARKKRHSNDRIWENGKLRSAMLDIPRMDSGRGASGRRSNNADEILAGRSDSSVN